MKFENITMTSSDTNAANPPNNAPSAFNKSWPDCAFVT